MKIFSFIKEKTLKVLGRNCIFPRIEDDNVGF